MISSERIALVMLGVTIVAAVCVIGVTRCSDSDIVPSQPLVVDTVAVPVATDSVTFAAPADSAGLRSRPANRRRKRKQRDVAAPMPPRDYLDERI
ncbi:MAG: hypothetical protein NC241_08690 [Bacteroides sp.]|nr:hypothetical protein [Bacteroides sp.]MCM1458426.1 hypothetical protein [Lachnoclostridium sp.]